MKRLLTAVLLLVVLLMLAEPAFACSVCFDANDETRGAFIGTTVVLSLMPLGMMGGLIYWLWRRARAIGDQPQLG